jgi:Nucleotidyltransferase
LSPLIGSEYDREGNRRATSRVAGVTSQNLRYVDVLLTSPWTVELSRANGFPFETPKQVRIAHPTRFMAQKLLIHDKRDRRSRAKDILYLHDTIELLGGSLDVLREEWTRLRKALPEGAIRTVEGALDTMFSKITDDIRGAAQAAAGRGLTPQAVQELCRAGMKIVFAPDPADALK